MMWGGTSLGSVFRFSSLPSIRAFAHGRPFGIACLRRIGCNSTTSHIVFQQERKLR